MSWQQLIVWQKAHELVLGIYGITGRFPQTERYGIIDRLRRASASVAANIVEGQSRGSTRDYIRFLFFSRGSLEETRYFLLLAKDLKYISEYEHKAFEHQCEEISRMLNTIVKKLQ